MFADESGESGLIVGAGGGLMGGEGGLVDKEGSLVDEGFLSKMSVEYEPLCIKREGVIHLCLKYYLWTLLKYEIFL